MEYLFLRHAETEISDRLEWHGSADPPLSATGRTHALKAGEKLVDLGPPITTIIASDHCRATETAALIANVLKCVVHRDPLLRERDLGEWSGLTLQEIEDKWPGRLEAWRQGHICGPPGGETDFQVLNRVVRALRGHANGLSAPKLVIAHAGLLRGLLASQGMPDEEVAPLSGRWLRLKAQGRKLVIGKETSL